MAQTLSKVDQNGLKTGQFLTIALLIMAFVTNSWVLVAFVAIAQGLGGLGASLAPYRLIYQNIVKPSGIVKPRMQDDDMRPHRFAMLVGALFNGSATVALLLGVPVVGWILVWIVIALANLNFWLNFCLGCWMYFHLGRLGVPGFTVETVKES